MKVFIAGATGVLGKRLVAECARAGHDVVGLARDSRGEDLVRERGGVPHRGDLFDLDTLVTGAADADVVVHAATKIPTDTNPDEDDWAANDRVRREGTENLVDAAGRVGADRFLQQSIVWLARQPDGRPFDETAEVHPDRSTASALDAERIVTRGADQHGFDPVILRGGYYYAADATHTRLIGRRVIDGNLPIVARGVLGRTDAMLSFVHVDDAARAFAIAVDGEGTGIYHVVDDDPTAYGEFINAFANRLEAPTPRRVPAWLARWFFDDNLLRMFTHPMPTNNDRIKDHFEWRPVYRTIESGISQVVAAWGEEGTIVPTESGYDWAAD